METVELEMLRRCAQVKLDATGIHFQEVKVVRQLDSMLNEMVFSLCVGLRGNRLEEKVFTYPADWWSAFKVRWFPKRLLKKYPAAMKVIRISANALYPSLKSKIPGERMVVLVNDAPPVCAWFDGEETV